MDLGQAVSGGVVAGIGFRGGATTEEIVALIREALASAGLAPGSLRAVATAEDRACAPALQAAAGAFGLAVTAFPPSALAAVDACVPTRSARIEAARGVGSVAEAAALAAAGDGAVLVLARIASGSVTCALAHSPETP